MRILQWSLGLLLGGLCALPQPALTAPRPLQDDIGIRQLLQIPERTMRIAKDPRDQSLYLQTATGDIHKVLVRPPDDPVPPLVARGVLDPDTEEITWTQFNLAGPIPDGVPIDAVRQAAADGTLSKTNPLNGKLYLLNVDDGAIMVLPRTVVAGSAEFGFTFLRALFIDDIGVFYVIRDVERASLPDLQRIYTSADHGLNDTQGLAIGPDGTFYVGGNRRQGNTNIITVAKGVLDPTSGQRNWSTLASTEPIPRGDVGAFNHFHPAVAVDREGRFIYINSGSRTEHGELATMNGQFPGLREAPLSSAILRVPADGNNIIIPADAAALEASGFHFSDGHRNAFDLTIGPEGELFAAENGPDWDMSDEINWVREGRHYGFPWRMGDYDNPQQFPDYDPNQDPLLQSNSWAKQNDLFYNDPTYPPPPPGVQFADPIVNMGPDANAYRTLDGQIVDGSDDGKAVFTLTAHSSPLGLVFDNAMAMGPPFKGSGFVLRIGGSIASLINSFGDPDQDLLHLDLEKTPDGENYQARVTRLVGGFDSPIDAEIVGNRIFVIEWGDTRGLWEITLPMNVVTAVEEVADALPEDSALLQNYPNPFNPNTTIEYRIDGFAPVKLTVYDALGQKIRTLVDAQQAPGSYRVRWDGRTDAGAVAGSGVYLYRLEAGPLRETRRLTLLK